MSIGILKRVMRAPYGAALALSILLQGLMVSMLATLLPLLLAEQIGLDKNEVIIFFLLNTLMGAAVTFGTGWLSDGLISRYKLALLGGMVGTLGFIGLAQATQPVHTWLAGLALAQFGVVFPQLFAAAKSGVVAHWEHAAQVMGLTALRTMFSLGFVVGTVIASGLARLDMRTVFMGLALPNLIVALSAAYLLYRIEQQVQPPQAPAGADGAATAPVASALPLWALAVPMLALLLLRGADSTRTTYLPLVTLHLFNDASLAPILFGLSAAAELVAMGVMGYAAGRFGEKVTIAGGALVGAAYYAVMAYSQSLPLLVISNILYALFTGATVGVAMVYLQHLMGPRTGLGGSLYMTLFNLGSLIGILAPLLVQNYDQTIFIAPIGLCLAGAALLLWGRTPRRTQGAA